MPDSTVTYVNSSTEIGFDDCYLVNASGGEITITLPEILLDGQNLIISKMNDAEHDVIIEPHSGNSLNVGSSIILGPYETARLMSYNDVWYRFY